MGVAQARRLNLIDRILPASSREHPTQIGLIARSLAMDDAFASRIAQKRSRREEDEAEKPLDAYRSEELARIRLNFYGFDPSYHVARFNFIHKIPKSRTPLTLASHRAMQRGGHSPNDSRSSAQG